MIPRPLSFGWVIPKSSWVGTTKQRRCCAPAGRAAILLGGKLKAWQMSIKDPSLAMVIEDLPTFVVVVGLFLWAKEESLFWVCFER